MSFNEIKRHEKKHRGEDSKQRGGTAEMMNSVFDTLNLRCLWDIQMGVSHRIYEFQALKRSL